MTAPRLTRYVSNGVTLLGDVSRPNGVTFAFTERSGGVSLPPFESLNLGGSGGDDPAAMAENVRRALVAVGAGPFANQVVRPHQVHGTEVVLVDDASQGALDAVRARALEGADAVVCTVPRVPVMLLFADCVPVVLVAPGGFAVVHSGWRGTIARISAVAGRVLCDATGCLPSQIAAYVGPHAGPLDYEVSSELLSRFEGVFGTLVNVDGKPRNLDLGAAVACTLATFGVDPCNVLDSGISTVSNTDRFYSFRTEGKRSGRHGAIAYLS